MYTELNRFSSKTVSEINRLSQRGVQRNKSEYNWRKEMEE